MAKIDKVQEVSIDKLRPYENNAKIHGAKQVEAIKRSIQEFGFLSPCLIDHKYNVIAGHGRIQACRELGMKTVPCLFIEGLSEDQRKAYILADNKLTEMGEWDWDVVNEELEDINIDMSAFGFVLDNQNEWFDRENRWDNSREEGNDEYNEFLDKFEQPKTTDDCYTPDNIYEVVADHVEKTYGYKKSTFVRPFYPNGDYQKENYPAGCCVVDNPPFSIFSEIIEFYLENNIKFFLFCDGGKSFNYLDRDGICVVVTAAAVTYENGAVVRTSFITNMETDGTAIDNDPQFKQEIEEANEENSKTNTLPQYEYPDEVLTAMAIARLSGFGQRLRINKKDCVKIRQLESQKESGKAIFGSGALLSVKATAERVKAEKAADKVKAEKAAERLKAEVEGVKINSEGKIVWELSEREKEIVRSLG